MEEKNSTFILAGNGPYDNRGCEAIVRGTVKIIRKYFNDPKFVAVTHFQDPLQYQLQRQSERDQAITHVNTHVARQKYSTDWWINGLLHIFYQEGKKNRVYKNMLPYLDNANAILSVGGDNYSLDYGFPSSFVDLDNIVLKNGKPLVIWGASVGPFGKVPEYERAMINHLKNVTAIFAREQVTVDYLEKNGLVDNVYHIADPAFLMDSVEPYGGLKDIWIDEDSIGINLSPLMARYVTEGNLEHWRDIAVKTVSNILSLTSHTIYLVPHVMTPDSNDYLFMKNVLSHIDDDKDRIILVDPTYTAPEIKWIISKLAVFAGARTHSTIAALSSSVPTLSFAYSAKAEGINQDIFGHKQFCVAPKQFIPKDVAKMVLNLSDSRDDIREELKLKIPQIQAKALLSGKYLKEVLTT